jgi:hypothetical protein
LSQYLDDTPGFDLAWGEPHWGTGRAAVITAQDGETLSDAGTGRRLGTDHILTSKTSRSGAPNAGTGQKNDLGRGQIGQMADDLETDRPIATPLQKGKDVSPPIDPLDLSIKDLSPLWLCSLRSK